MTRETALYIGTERLILHELPENIPAPVDDGACDHLVGMRLPSVALTSTAARLHLPFELLSDAALEFTQQLRLPTFAIDGMTLVKRLTLIARDGRIEKVFYPVFPPDKNAEEVIRWLVQITTNGAN